MTVSREVSTWGMRYGLLKREKGPAAIATTSVASQVMYQRVGNRIFKIHTPFYLGKKRSKGDSGRALDRIRI